MYGDPLPRTLTVAELREALSDFDDDALVVMQYDYGDYHHTQAVEVIQEVQMMTLVPSAYSRTGHEVLETDEDEEDDDEGIDEESTPALMAVVLSCR